MSPEEKILLEKLIIQTCAEDPSFVSTCINAATEGVKLFADKQNDSSSKMAFMMSQILSDKSDLTFGAFSRKDILCTVSPWLGGTAWHKNELEKLEAK